jgi:Mn2+/Fe2+ NRAMP family transporter
MLVSNNKRVMGRRKNGLGTNILGWLATAIMFAAAIGMFVTWNN